MTQRIADYALIGDCETAALVGRDGSIDWLCLPRFDSDACFTALLGSRDHGHWLLKPKQPVKATRRYRDKTLILETHFETESGAVTIVDFMAKPSQRPTLVRHIVGQRGRVAMTTELVIRFGYGDHVPWVTRLSGGALRAIAGPDMVIVESPVDLHGENFRTVGDFAVEAGETLSFVMSYWPSHLPPKPSQAPKTMLAATESFWRQWIAKSQSSGPWSDVVDRSLITLKALTYARTGGIVAAPTTSLPEQIGGARNWDYRFCWLRDATLTLLALMNAGYYQEAHDWREWLLRAVAGSPNQLQIMYGIAGERRLTEWEVPWLPGYRNSRPVRIGNAAHGQLQLDVYGELMDALHQGRKGRISASTSGWALQLSVLDHLETVWAKPDSGIWEVRSAPEHFTYSKVMAWVAFDRAIKSAEQYGLAGPVDRWRARCKQIHDDVCRKGFNAERGSFVRAYGSQELDASLLLLPEVGFLPPEDPRIRGTVEAIERDLVVDGLVQRYDTSRSTDGLPGHEGAFLACSFWLVDAYTMLGRMGDAARLFERLLSLCNDVGLLSEEYDVKAGELVGNFPQALSHIALVNSASNLGEAEKPAKQRAEVGQPATSPA